MFDSLNLDLTETQETSFDPIPAGKYRLQIQEATLHDTQAGTGQYIKTTFMVVEGQCEGRKIFHNFNIVNPNEKAQQIGLGQLKSLLVKSGRTSFKLGSPEDLAGICVWASVGIKTSTEYNDQNVVKSFVTAPESGTTLPKEANAPAPF